MLTALSIRDIVLIEKLDLSLDQGMCVLTGETGAGKSILLDSLGLALGARGDAGLVRHGAERGSVTAAFDISGHKVAGQLLADAEIDHEGEVVLRRVQNANGTSRAMVNDQPVSVGFLKSLGEVLCEIHGQHEARALIDAGHHLDLVDAYGGFAKDREALSQLWSTLRSARKALEDHRAKIEKAASEEAFLRYSLEELAELDPQTGEEEELASLRQVMMHAEKFSKRINDVLEGLTGDSGLGGVLSGPLRRLEMVREEAGGRLDEAVAALERLVVEANEAEAALQAARGAFDFDGTALEKAEARLFALRGLARKHKVTVDGLVELKEQFASALEAIETGESRLEALEAAYEEAKEAFVVAARALSEKRIRAARRLDEAVMAELGPLKLEKVRFETQIVADEDQLAERGIDRIEFVVSTNPGAPLSPMAKVASGGELSRIMLALKATLAARVSAPTLIFDEVDTGVGGAVADAIGKRLSEMSRHVQVLAVTHSPQVAARSDDHLLISKFNEVGEGDERALTRVVRLESGARREELARMLSGEAVTEEARAQADRLMGGG